MYFSKHIQGSPSKATFTWINTYTYRNPPITSFTVLFRPNNKCYTMWKRPMLLQT